MRACFLAVLLMLASCGGGDAATGSETVVGVVVEVEGALESVEAFTVLVDDGTVLRFEPSDGLLFDGGPLSHLQSHRLNGAPIEVTYVEEEGRRIATRVTDAATGHHDE